LPNRATASGSWGRGREVDTQMLGFADMATSREEEGKGAN